MAALLSVYAISVGFIIASEHSVSFMISQNRYVLAVCFETGEIFVRLILLLAPLWLGYGFYGLIVGIVLFSILRFLVRSFYLFAKSGFHFGGWTKSTFVAEQLNYSVPIALVSVTALIGSVFNKGIIAASFTPAVYAIYAVGDMPIPIASVFQASVANVLRASLPPLVRDGQYVEVVRIIREATRKLSIIVLPSFVFLYGFSQELVTVLFTARYSESVHILRINLWSVPLDMLILSPIPQIFGRTRLNLYINMANTAMLLVLSYVLLKWIGFYGAAIASVASQIFTSFLFLVAVLKLARTSFPKLLALAHMLRTILTSLVALLVAQLSNGMTGSGLLNLIIGGVIFSLVFITLAPFTGVLNGEDRQLIRRWLEKILPFVRSR